MPTRSRNHFEYYLTFTDDFSRKSWVYFLKTKSEVFAKFKEFRAIVEKQSGYQIKTLRTDNGGEYVNTVFQEYLVTHGIQSQLTCPYTPEQNGVAERLNRTLKSRAHAMLHHASIPVGFWPEAIAYANHVKNVSPTRALVDMVPDGAWFKRTPNIANLRVFGCTCFVHVDSQLRTTFQPRAKVAKFLGISTTSKGYLCYLLDSRTIVTSSHVTFHETVFDATLVEDPPSAAAEPATHPLSPATLVSSVSSQPASLVRRNPVRACRLASSNLSIDGPSSHSAAKRDIHSADWKAAEAAELASLSKNETWDLVPTPANTNIIDSRWVYTRKCNSDGSLGKFKARCVAKGYSQEPGSDFFETYAPTAKMDTIRFFLALSAHRSNTVHQMDVQTAFLNGPVDTELYMKLPPGYRKSGTVCKLKKCIYGLRQAPRQWNIMLSDFIKSLGFCRSQIDSCLYFHNIAGNLDILLIYVDDILISSTSAHLEKLKHAFTSHFSMSDLGLVTSYLGIHVESTATSISISQPGYILELFDRFNLTTSNAVHIPLPASTVTVLQNNEFTVDHSVPCRSLIGSLLYLAICTRPDISFAVSFLSRFLNSPSSTLYNAGMHILRYVKTYPDLKLTYHASASPLSLSSYCDASWADCLQTRKSTSGYVINFNDVPIAWSSKKQTTVAGSTAEAEYIALHYCSLRVMGIINLLSELSLKPTYAVPILEDNAACISIATGTSKRHALRHIDLKIHKIRELVEKSFVKVVKCPTIDMTADIFTKPLSKAIFNSFISKLFP